MSTDGPTTLATFAATLPILLVAHNLADHVTGQTHKQATTKGAPSPEQIAAGADPHSGWAALLGHVAWYHATLAAVGALAWLALPIHWSAPGAAAALAWSALTHGFIDRRWPVRRLLTAMGKRGYAELASGGMNGMYQVDQALHHTMLLASAVLAVVIR